MTPLCMEDAAILALESGPIRGHTVKLLVIEGSPGDSAVDAVRAEIGQRLPGLARWRQRLVPDRTAETGFAWQDDPDFDVARHVRAACDARPVDDRELRRIVARTMMAPLDRARPLWSLEVVPRLTGDRWAIVWKVHHCLADGVATMRAGGRLLWTEEESSKRHAPRRSAPAPASTRRMMTLIRHRGLMLREFRRVRIWQLSPLAVDVGPERDVAFVECPLDELRAFGKAIGPDVTINDVLLSVVAGALRRWLEDKESPRARMKVQVPVSMHPHLGEEDPFGNRDSFLFVDLPVREADPVARVRAVSQATRLRKNRHDAQAIDALRRFLGRAPAPVRGALRRVVQGPHEYSLNVSNVPFPAGRIRVLGRQVEAMYALAEVAPHHALRVAAVSLDGVLYIGLCADAQVVPDLEVIAEGIRASVDELRTADRRARATLGT